MKVVVINGSDFGSTGKISLDIINYVSSKGNIDCDFYVSNKRTNLDNVFCIDNNKIIKLINKIIVKIFGSDGFRSFINTRKFIRKLKKEKIDLIHIHSLHGYYINMKMLFKFIENNKIPVIWTLHDNWVFTGRCAFVPLNCEKYKTECKKCRHLKLYPRTFIDRANHYYKLKQKTILSLSNLVFVSPSKYNADMRLGTPLENTKMLVINNGINLDIFHHLHSTLRQKYNLENKFVILCVAYPWSDGKGLQYINKLAGELDPNIFKILMVGVTENVETHPNIIRIAPIYDQTELSKYYSMADIFLTPSFADNYPTVAMESLSCGCPVVGFNVGGIKEIVSNDVGIIVPKGDYEKLKAAVLKMYNQPINREICIDYSQKFSKLNMVHKYYELYISMTKK